MNKKLFLIPPTKHLYYLPKFIKDENVSSSTKVSVIFENIILYVLVGLIAGVTNVGFWMFLSVLVFAFLLSPLEWRIIKVTKSKVKKSITNWENFESKKSYYSLQYQLMGYVVIGYIIGIILVLA